MSKKRVHLIYKILLSVSLMVMGACLIVACVGIYLSGDRPFSAEAVSTAFGSIAIPVYLCLLLILGGFFLDGFIPQKQPKLTAVKQHAHTLEKLKSKLDLDRCKADLRKSIQKEQSLRKLRHFFILGELIVCTATSLYYCTNPDHFDIQNINGSIVRAAVFLCVWLTIPFVSVLFATQFSRRSMQKEVTLVKEAIAAGAVKAEIPQPAVKKTNAANIVRFAILGIGIAIFVYGFITGGTADVLTKAVNICTECVGLG